MKIILFSRPLVQAHKEQIVEIGKKEGWTFYVDQPFVVAEFGDAKVTFRLKDGADASLWGTDDENPTEDAGYSW